MKRRTSLMAIPPPKPPPPLLHHHLDHDPRHATRLLRRASPARHLPTRGGRRVRPGAAFRDTVRGDGVAAAAYCGPCAVETDPVCAPAVVAPMDTDPPPHFHPRPSPPSPLSPPPHRPALCPAGKYGPHDGRAPCRECAKGRFTDEAGTNKCAKVPVPPVPAFALRRYASVCGRGPGVSVCV